MRKKQVLGFAFSADENDILLIKKERPEYLAGLLNGIGGNEESGDANSMSAMIRKFEEETGIMTSKEDWRKFVTFHYDDETEVCCFVMRSDLIYSARTQPSKDPAKKTEEIYIFPCMDWQLPQPQINNLSWLIPMALDTDVVDGLITLK